VRGTRRLGLILAKLREDRAGRGFGRFSTCWTTVASVTKDAVVGLGSEPYWLPKSPHTAHASCTSPVEGSQASICSAPEVLNGSRAFGTSSAVPCATRTNLPALIDVSYFRRCFWERLDYKALHRAHMSDSEFVLPILIRFPLVKVAWRTPVI
jgi:hypothetical protein